MTRRQLRLHGRVQGVGLRPRARRLAAELGVHGSIANSAGAVRLDLHGTEAALDAFATALQSLELPGYRPTGLEWLHDADAACTGAPEAPAAAGLRIVDSDASLAPAEAVAADRAPCAACLAELFDPANRRHRHPFISCIDCGPRFSIASAAPFDRQRTSMARFPLCARCRAEYDDVQGRRAHAQTLCCPDCGPTLAWRDAAAPAGPALTGAAALAAAVAALRAGRIVALRGLGGYQLAVDAGNPGAVARLRARKHRPARPFAVMVESLAAAAALCMLDATERALLAGPRAPVLLAQRRAGTTADLTGVAPGLPWLGLMLPATPLHALLLHDCARPLVMTSGNRRGDPLCTSTDEAATLLGDIADGFLEHDRDIVQPLDDSVLRVVVGRALLLRRARGYVPEPISLAPRWAQLPPALGAGGHLKSSVARIDAGQGQISAHIGDLDGPRARARHARALTALAMAGPACRALGIDAHPDYGCQPAAQASGLALARVQHHHAHALAVLAECAPPGPVLAVVWDGVGLGSDGGAWGGELLRVEGAVCQRIGRLRPFRLPGGDGAARDPRRSALALLWAAGRCADEALTASLSGLEADPARVLTRLLATGLRSPWTSSAGRLFDGLSALLGLCRQPVSHEAQAAMALEAAASAVIATGAGAAPGIDAVEPYPVALAQVDGLLELDWRPLLHALLDDLGGDADATQLAARVHAGLATAIASAARRCGLPVVVLAGGCFQNAILLEQSIARLRAAGLRVCWPRALPPNDGALALGQALGAALAPPQDPPPSPPYSRGD